MSSALVLALIALVGSVFSAAVVAWGQWRTSRFEADRDASAVLSKYREPLVDAAYDLQSRIYNILRLDFFGKYLVDGTAAERRYAIDNTLYVIAQYFAWTEILRRKIQFMNFGRVDRTRRVAERQRAIVQAFQSDDPGLGVAYRVWRGEQRAIGEQMIVEAQGEAQVLGYSQFATDREHPVWLWLAHLEASMTLPAPASTARLTLLQHALVDLIRELDPEAARYGRFELERV